jgi:hypothetical protein
MTPRVIRYSIPFAIFLFSIQPIYSQTRVIEGKEFTRYRPKYFKPKLRIHYNIYLSPSLTVDPLNIGGKSAYAISVGTRINLWESKTPMKALQGLKVNGWYFGGGYEYYPQQYDKIYASLWIRIKTFMQDMTPAGQAVIEKLARNPCSLFFLR